jgi:hypothetical protein
MVAELTEGVIRTIQDAARKLTGGKRRKFEAQVAINYCQGSARKAETNEFSRGGKSRGRQPKKAGDHDMNPQATLIPFGILETARSQLFTVFGTSRETSDFIVDCLQLWWDERKTAYPQIRKLQIDLDNGPELASNRTQFINRMVQFADRNGLTIELVYYPPYHSKYNSVERCWGILEQHWRGAIFRSLSRRLKRSESLPKWSLEIRPMAAE